MVIESKKTMTMLIVAAIPKCTRASLEVKMKVEKPRAVVRLVSSETKAIFLTVLIKAALTSFKFAYS